MGEDGCAVRAMNWRTSTDGVWRALRRRAMRLLTLLALAFMLAQSAPTHAAADARTGYLVKLLKGSTQFRVRTQAAISLGSVSDSPQAEEALREALKDRHPAVRAAAAASLGRLGVEAAVAAIERLRKDPEAPVRAAADAALKAIQRSQSAPETPTQPRTSEPAFYVAIGSTNAKVPQAGPSKADRMADILREQLRSLDGVELAPKRESERQARRVLKKRKLKGYVIDASITSVQPRAGGGTRVAVSVVVSTYPDHDMRAILSGAATAVGGGSDRAFEQALEGAITGALRQLPQALGR